MASPHVFPAERTVFQGNCLLKKMQSKGKIMQTKSHIFYQQITKNRTSSQVNLT